MTPKTYKIVKTDSFNKDVTRLSEKIRRLDEFIKGVEEVLCRNPRYGKPTKNKYVLAFNMRSFEENPPLTLYYLHTNVEVVFLFLRADGDAKPPPMIL